MRTRTLARRTASAALATIALLTPNAAGAGARPDSHAPIGVMSDHNHDAGEWMLSYRYMRMFMEGSRDGTRDLSASDVLLRGFMVTPTRMTTQKHVFGVMYAPHDRLTLMAMLPYVRKSMEHVNRAGVEFTTRSEGVGDIRFSGLLELFGTDHHQVLLNAGLSVPSGSIRQKDFVPGPGRVRLPYPMQIGSGSWDLLPGFTYNGHLERLSWGVQALGTLRTAKNGQGYRLGDRLDASGWAGLRWTDWLSTALRLRWSQSGNIAGSDTGLPTPPAVVPTADPKRRRGRRLDVGFGVNAMGTRGVVKHHRLAFEFLLPVYEHLDGPQLATEWTLVGGWQWAF